MKKLVIVCLLLVSWSSFAQTGVIRGTITDKQSEKSIVGATIELVSDPSNSTNTDERGNFELLNVPLGRQTIRVSYLGYESSTVPDIDVNRKRGYSFRSANRKI
ncbi:carboxypeptidase regulatory-like domain-containing protein [Flavobacterium sp.]|uniref:carboxypeptidase regulatory-like domain-containing protein n=1 Tax=Flavobacterium sp. TaxID=239 RepID=UPI0022CAF5D2|nr:carboxypeptidase regulatory-like domain-containing protein [Flavobacterium sp.]MCZ8091123.1 carboxypeptidase-like regulatory domain-containing protein [Flavobacterium sp.]